MSKFDETCENILNEQAKPTQEMKDWFEERTNKHIKRVQKNWRKLYDTPFNDYLEEIEDKEKHIYTHDASKFQEPEYTPYLFITWSYKMRDEGKEYEIPGNMKQEANDATTYHVFHNPHHPVYWDKSASMEDNVINDKDRDKPTEQVTDGTQMPKWAICEMLCDWAAVSQERGTSLKGWADMNVGDDKRWKFTEDQTKLIYDLVKFFEEK